MAGHQQQVLGSFTDADSAEGVKGAVHGAFLTLSAMCLAYNACAWHKRRQTHLAANAAVYGLLVGFEALQVWRHWR